jgi:hypothetical protein
MLEEENIFGFKALELWTVSDVTCYKSARLVSYDGIVTLSQYKPFFLHN